MILKYLGTSASEGSPALFCECENCQRSRAMGGREIRTRAQAIIDKDLLIDFGDDTYLNSLRHNIHLSHVKFLLITHSHADHFNPKHLAFRGGWFGTNMPVDVLHGYGNEDVCRKFEAVKESFFEEVKPHSVFHLAEPFVPFEAGEYTITPLLADHDPKQVCLIYLIEKDGKRLLYGNDTGEFPEETFKYLEGIKLDAVSLDCTVGVNSASSGHMGLPNNIAVQKRLEAQGSTYEDTKFICTHISHALRYTHEEFAKIAGEKGFIVAYDGMELAI